MSETRARCALSHRAFLCSACALHAGVWLGELSMQEWRRGNARWPVKSSLTDLASIQALPVSLRIEPAAADNGFTITRISTTAARSVRSRSISRASPARRCAPRSTSATARRRHGRARGLRAQRPRRRQRPPDHHRHRMPDPRRQRAALRRGHQGGRHLDPAQAHAATSRSCAPSPCATTTPSRRSSPITGACSTSRSISTAGSSAASA